MLCLTTLMGEWVQNTPLQNVPLQHVDYFELKIIKTQQTQENFYLSINGLMRDSFIERTITRDNVLSVWQHKHLVTKQLPILGIWSCELPSNPWKPQAPILFLSSEWDIGHHCSTCPGVSYCYGTSYINH